MMARICSSDEKSVQKNTPDWKWLYTTVVYKENCNDSENWRTYFQGKVFLPDMYDLLINN